MKGRFFPAMFLGLMLTGCASLTTPTYHKYTVWKNYGYTSKMLSANTASIHYEVCAGCDPAYAKKFAFQRASEMTREHGFAYYKVLSQSSGRVSEEEWISHMTLYLKVPYYNLKIKMYKKSVPGAVKA